MTTKSLLRNPLFYAVTYGIITSTAVALSSILEGTFYDEKTITISGTDVIQYPYMANISTILDFAILNPITIFFLVSVRKGFCEAFDRFQKGGDLSPFTKLGLIFVSVAFGTSAMWFYFQKFIGQTFFTAVFVPNSEQVATISITGWVVFVGTSVFIAFLIFVFFEFGNFIMFVRHLSQDDLRFRLPPNVSKEIEIAVMPCLHFLYVLTTLFIIIVLFILRDFVTF